MQRYVAFLRGINVGGRQKVAMSDVRDVLISLGHGDVTTILQSGNALFNAAGTDTSRLASALETRLLERLGLEVKVLVRTPAELAAIVAANPFPGAVAEPSKVHVAFLSATPAADRAAEMASSHFAPDQFHLGEQVMYLWYPTGAGRTKLTNAVLERRLGVTATSRNWNTVTKLLARRSEDDVAPS